MKLGMIGAGSIARHHIIAARQAGFDVSYVCARPNSLNAHEIAKKYNIPKVLDSEENLFKTKVDAITICSSTNSHIEILNKIGEMQVPILIEKPISTNPEDFNKLDRVYLEQKVIVGLNRRHYNSIKRLKTLIQSFPEKVSFSANIPEFSWDMSPDPETGRIFFIDNNCHTIDILNYVFGRMYLEAITPLPDGSFSNRTALVHTEFGHVGSLNISFSSSANYSIEVFGRGKYFHLKPLEILSVYSGVETEPITNTSVYKKYKPKLVEQTEPIINQEASKLGFLGQYNDLKSICLGASVQEITSASIFDAYNAISICNSII